MLYWILSSMETPKCQDAEDQKPETCYGFLTASDNYLGFELEILKRLCEWKRKMAWVMSCRIANAV